MKRNIDLSGGGAAASLPTFLGCVKEEAKTSHLAQPTQICLKFKKNSSTEKYSSNLEMIINGRIPSFPITIDIAEDTKAVKVIISFKRPEDLEKAKGLLKTLEIPFTDKGKTSNRKPEFSVVQPKKCDQKVESEQHLEPFPLGILGDHYLAPVQLMHQSTHKFLHPHIYNFFSGPTWSIDDTRWGNTVNLQYYQSSKSLGTRSYCVPHPNNPESRRQIVEMQQMGPHYHTLRNWTHSGFVRVPVGVLEIPAYWIPDCCGLNEDIQKPDPATLISSPQAPISSPYPVFDKDAFIAGLGEEVKVSVHPKDPKSQSAFWLKESVASALFQTDACGNITTNLRTRFAQMIGVNAYVKNPGISRGTSDGENFPGIKDKVPIPDHLLIFVPGSTWENIIRQMTGKSIDGRGGNLMYKRVGEVLIPWQILKTPQAWEIFERSSYSSY
jgi:hypothetical protein